MLPAERPLTDDEYQWIAQNHRDIIANLDSGELLPVLFYKFQCISQDHFNKIKLLKHGTEEMNKNLLEVVIKRSKADNDNFQRALEMTGQQSLADVLKNGAGG